MRGKISISDVSAKLAGQAEAVCRMLLPAGKKHGKLFECGSVYGEEGKTLKVQLDGPHAGKWQDWNGGEKGDLLDLWALAKGIPVPDALRQAKEFLGIREPTLPEREWKHPHDDKLPLSADGAAMQWLGSKRKLEPPVVNRYRVQGDAASRAIVFPCYSPKGVLVNRSFRTIAGETKKVWQDTGAAPSLFGWQSLTPETYQRREVLICEGQIDAMTWAQWGIPALSIPNGTGKTWLESEWANLEAFKTILLAFDSDSAGQTNAAEVAARLGKHRVKFVRYPHKDANAALQAGVGAAEAREWVEKAEYATVSHLVTAAHYVDATIEQFFPSAAIAGHPLSLTRHDNDELTFRFRPGELSVWTGVSSHGKSTMLNYGMIELSGKTKLPSLIVTLEMQPAKVLRRIMLATGMDVKNEADVRDWIEHLKSWLLFCDRVGQIDRDELFEILAYANARYGVAHACIDSMMRVKGLEEDYPAQNQFVVDLATFARDSGMHIHLVCHPRKQQGHNAPEAHDIKGSGHIRDNADNVIVVWRNREKEKLLESKLMDDRVKAEKMPDAFNLGGGR